MFLKKSKRFFRGKSRALCDCVLMLTVGNGGAPVQKAGPLDPVLKGSDAVREGEGAPRGCAWGRHVTGRACHFEKKKLRKDGFAPFLSFFVFCVAFLFGSFWGVSPDLRAKSRLRRLRSETRLRAQCDGRPKALPLESEP